MISVIIATYNRPHYLRRAIDGLLHQTGAPPFEIVIADDGSTHETADMLMALSRQSSLPIVHAWHEDRGFRLAEVRNLAVSRSSGEALIFLDDDCIAPPNFVRRYAGMLRRGRLVFGERVLMSKALTDLVVEGSVVLHDWTLADWLSAYRRGDVDRFSRQFNLPLGPLRHVLRNAWTAAEGCNFGVTRGDLEKVNGFDSDFVGWGCEDWDFAARMWHSGIRMYDGRFSLAVAHLWHVESTRAQLSVNQARLDETVRTRRIRATRGLADLPSTVHDSAHT